MSKSQSASKSQSQSQSQSASKSQSAKKTPMGPSGYRAKYGISDQQIMEAVRTEFPRITFGDDDILGSIGWALTSKCAITKIRTLIES